MEMIIMKRYANISKGDDCIYNKNEVLTFLRKHYPNEKTEDICKELDLSKSIVYTLARRNNIYKSDEYLKKLHMDLMKYKEEKYLSSIPEISLNQLEQNIIIGSVLGDGNLTFAPRSRNAYYREHFSIKQKEYREWKMNNIHSMKFKIEKECHLKSPSHPVFTELYDKFYINDIKTITEDNIKLLNHPIGLACIYMDDGTLTINSAKRRKDKINIFPRISIYTQSFSKEENIILRNHLKRNFGVITQLNRIADGKYYILRINKKESVINFVNLVKPYIEEIPSMEYKINIPKRFSEKRDSLLEFGYTNINSYSENVIDNSYSADDEAFILEAKKNGMIDRNIAKALDRSYWGIVDKIRRMKKSQN
jgi:hypothetical protein